MNILFIVAGVQPGADGVGDYTRLLARTLSKMGNNVLIFAGSDRAVHELSVEKDGPIDIVRVPPSASRAEFESALYKLMFEAKPDWISLQFVGYGWQQRGLPLGLPSKLKEAASTVHLHVMFHELWVGSVLPERPRLKLIGFLQKNLSVRRLLKVLRPELVSTSIKAYADILRDLKQTVLPMPLFGNIPLFFTKQDESNLRQKLQVAIKQHDANGEIGQFILVGFFGAVYPEACLDYVLEKLIALSRDESKGLVIVSIGRLDDRSTSSWKKMHANHSASAIFLDLGESKPAEISCFLNSIRFGVATTQLKVLLKSGTLAAMLDHGVPVIAAGAGQEFHRSLEQPDYRVFGPGRIKAVMDPELDLWLRSVKRRSQVQSVDLIARIFVDGLHKLGSPS